ncbi:PTS transporter subunit EIIC [Liquorilactobacillus cacaonum]|nr:PTS transporter subunit EIIC [Liquorilactobacillus cacaonum]
MRNYIRYLVSFEHFIKNCMLFRIINETLVLLFPFVLIGTYIDLLRKTVFEKNGFLNNIYYVSTWLFGFKLIGNFLTLLDLSVNGVIAIAMAYLTAKITTKKNTKYNLAASLTAVFAFMIMNFNGSHYLKNNNQQVGKFLATNFSYSGCFWALIVGLVTGWIFNKFFRVNQVASVIDSENQDLQEWLATTLKPVAITLLFFGICSWMFSLFSKVGANHLITTPVHLAVSHGFLIPIVAIFSIIFNNILWLFGIIGLFQFNDINAGRTVENLEYAIQHGSAWGAPNPVTLHILIDSFANIGGPGMLCAMLLAILWRSRNKDLKTIVRAIFVPSIFNITQSPLVGLIILRSPVLGIPFLLTPVVSVFLTWLALHFSLIAPSVYPLSKATPGILVGWLGTGGTWQSLVFGIVNVVIGTILYLPFVLVGNMSTLKQEQVKSDEK